MLKEKIYKSLPHFFQNALVTLHDFLAYRQRHGTNYYSFKKKLKDLEFVKLGNLVEYQEKELITYLRFCKEFSPYYSAVLKDIDVEKGYQVLNEIPICDKEDFRGNIDKIVSENKANMYVSKTGGTTGKSMQVYYRKDDFQERFALLDNFRERFNYKFGEKTAWFSGKDILTSRDIKRNRYWKRNWLHNIRYYSTFNINPASLKYYIEDLEKFKPKFIVGFPSSIVEIARYGLINEIKLGFKVKAIFPTAETKIEKEAEDITAFFGGGVYDQYASSEGACFITECEKGNLHFELSSGVIEVVDENNRPSQEGRMLITAFHTRGTPLIRYDIGDTMKWSEMKNCACGRKMPIVESIQGRINDYIYSEQTGKCNLGNISNCLKYVKGVKRFQIVQDEIDKIHVLIEKTSEYSSKDENMFLTELRARLGEKISIKFKYVNQIEREKSGKFRIVKNSIRHLIQN